MLTKSNQKSSKTEKFAAESCYGEEIGSQLLAVKKSEPHIFNFVQLLLEKFPKNLHKTHAPPYEPDFSYPT